MVVNGLAARLQSEFIHFRFDSGIVLMVMAKQCPGCKGAKKILIKDPNNPGKYTRKTCPKCDGKGKFIY